MHQFGTTSPQLHVSTSGMPNSDDPMLTDIPNAAPGDAIPPSPSPMGETPVCLPCNSPTEPPPVNEVVKVRKMLNTQKASPKKNPRYSNEDIYEANDLRLMKLASCGGCVNRREEV